MSCCKSPSRSPPNPPLHFVWQKILAAVLFSICFGLLEAVVVAYLRQILGPGSALVTHTVLDRDVRWSLGFITFLKADASSVVIADKKLLSLELWREAATIGMLSMLGCIAGNKVKEKLAYFLLVFGVWDIFYYVFLRLLTGWPKNLLDLDVFFLIPVAWVGPVMTPLTISFILGVVSIFILTKGEKRP